MQDFKIKTLLTTGVMAFEPTNDSNQGYQGIERGILLEWYDYQPSTAIHFEPDSDLFCQYYLWTSSGSTEELQTACEWLVKTMKEKYGCELKEVYPN